MRKKDILILVTAIFSAIVLAASQFLYRALPTGAWGLHFQTAGQPPQGPADAVTLAKYDAAFLGDTQQPVIYLTFDAGYENGCTPRILDALKAQDVKAAFFLVGNYIERNPDLVRRMVEEGHIVANHTMHHPDMRSITDKDKFQAELTQLEDLFLQTTGKEMPKYYRPPQGTYSQQNLEHAKALGYKTVFWSLAYADWRNDAQPTDAEAFAKLLPRTHNGAVVLLHSTSETNARILPELLTRWKEMGMTFGTLDDLFRDA